MTSFSCSSARFCRTTASLLLPRRLKYATKANLSSKIFTDERKGDNGSEPLDFESFLELYSMLCVRADVLQLLDSYASLGSNSLSSAELHRFCVMEQQVGLLSEC